MSMYNVPFSAELQAVEEPHADGLRAEYSIIDVISILLTMIIKEMRIITVNTIIITIITIRATDARLFARMRSRKS